MESEQFWRKESAAEKAEHLKVLMRASADCWMIEPMILSLTQQLCVWASSLASLFTWFTYL